MCKWIKILSYVFIISFAGTLIHCALGSSPKPKNYIYFCVVEDGVGKIKRTTTDGSAQENILTGLPALGDIEIDAVGGMMYWVDDENNDIYRAFLDGSDRERIIDGTDGINDKIRDIELDAVHKKLYRDQYFNIDGTYKIYTAGFDGMDEEFFCTSSVGISSEDMAVDTDDNKIYCVTMQISWFDLDDPLNINGHIDTPAERGLALDPDEDKLYFGITAGNIDIYRINTDGTGKEQLNISNNFDICDIALDPARGKVYWATCFDGISRANLDGTDEEFVVQLDEMSGDTITGIALLIQE
jgi:hypothetical protein